MGVSAESLAGRLESVCSHFSGLRPYGSFEQLSIMTPEQIERAYRIVSLQHQRLQERTASIFDVEADRKDFFVTLSDLKLLCVDEILAKFEGGDIIEIYDLNFLQLYHNWIFHYYCSYDLLTLVTEPIWALYSRPQEINALIESRVQDVLKNEKGPVRWNIPPHFLKETKLGTPRVFRIEFQWICPVRDRKGRPVAFVSTNKCTPTEIMAI